MTTWTATRSSGASPGTRPPSTRPVRLGTTVQRLTAEDSGGHRFRLETDRGTIRARDVVVATGAFHIPKIPPAAAGFSSRIHQVHAHDYRNPGALPPGGVLLVGSGQTGVQLAEELQEAGRDVTLSVGHCGRAPRRYRGRDFFWWLRQLVDRGPELGTPLPTVDMLPDPRARFACNPHLSGHGGGHDTNLRRFAANGIRLVGRFEAADGERVRFAEDLSANLRFADEFFDQRFRTLYDTFAERAGVELPPDDRESFDFEPPEVTELDLASAGISTVLWTTGYTPDYGWLDLPVLGDGGLPRHVRGVSDVPGLTFLGMLWQHTQASANLGWRGEGCRVPGVTLGDLRLDGRQCISQMHIRDECLVDRIPDDRISSICRSFALICEKSAPDRCGAT